jgi:hypothetical protein
MLLPFISPFIVIDITLSARLSAALKAALGLPRRGASPSFLSKKWILLGLRAQNRATKAIDNALGKL